MRVLGCAFVVLCVAIDLAAAQDISRMITWANVWDANQDQVYTCEEWKKYVNDLFTKADRNRDGFLDAQEFKSIRDAAPQFKDADLAYFDDNRDGRLSRAEFVDSPNPFFLRFDKKHTCKVTIDNIVDSESEKSSPANQGGPRQRPSH